MSTYRVIEASINIHAGVLVLDAAQADARKHRLTPLGDNRYEVSDPPVMFKRGEVFELEGELPKALVLGTEATEGFSKVEAWHGKPGPKAEPIAKGKKR
jgi:hypothetical protein